MTRVYINMFIFILLDMNADICVTCVYIMAVLYAENASFLTCIA